MTTENAENVQAPAIAPADGPKLYPVQIPACVAVLVAFKPFLSKDETRAVLAFVGIQGGMIYATDGHRAIRSSLEAIGVPLDTPEGVYRLTFQGTGKKKTADLYGPLQDQGTYPQAGAIYPKEGAPVKWSFDGCAGPKGRDTGGTFFKLAIHAGATVNPDLLAEMPDERFTFSGVQPRAIKKGYMSAIRMQAGAWDILLMPMRR